MARAHHLSKSQADFSALLWRFVTRTLLALAVLLFVIGVVSSVSSVRMILLRTAVAVMGASPPQDELGHTNILLLGVGDTRHDGAGLTDTMMIASIDPATRSAVLLSIPRDLYLSGNTRLADGRINTLYMVFKGHLRATNRSMSATDVSRLALSEVADEIGRKFGVPIHGVIKGDFTTFTDTVDAMGGVDIDVPKAITDYTYPLRENVVGTFHVDAGRQHFDGETALKYARTRHSGTDFDRSVRQQQLLRALVDTVRSMNRIRQLSFVRSVLQIVSTHLESTMTMKQLLGLTQIATVISSENILSYQINYSTGGDYSDAKAGGFIHSGDSALYEGADVLIPSVLPTDETGWKQIRTFVSFLVDHRDLYLAQQRVQVVNVSANAFAAYRLENELRRYGFTVEEVKNPTSPRSAGLRGAGKKVDPNAKKPAALPVSFITFSGGEDKRFSGFLGGLLHMNISKFTPDEAGGTGSAIRIVLGKDYKYVPFQALVGTDVLVR